MFNKIHTGFKNTYISYITISIKEESWRLKNKIEVYYNYVILFSVIVKNILIFKWEVCSNVIIAIGRQSAWNIHDRASIKSSIRRDFSKPSLVTVAAILSTRHMSRTSNASLQRFRSVIPGVYSSSERVNFCDKSSVEQHTASPTGM